jgi:predicted phosphodiesterase
MKITFISDTHTKHAHLTHDLPGGDILIHAGDLMNSGYDKNDIYFFLNWYKSVPGYSHKIFIAGNHDRIFEFQPDFIEEVLEKYPEIDYLEDFSKELYIPDHNPIKIYGSPWQPEFYNWAFNLPRNGEELERKWNNIPEDTDILITHGPAYGYLDTSGPPYNEPFLGCELLIKRIKEIKPKIHVCGHIHGGYGYKFDGETHFFNASVLNERYVYSNIPLTVDWDPEKNEIEFLT